MDDKLKLRMDACKQLQEMLEGLLAVKAVDASLAMHFYLCTIALFMESEVEMASEMLPIYFRWHGRYNAFKEKKTTGDRSGFAAGTRIRH